MPGYVGAHQGIPGTHRGTPGYDVPEATKRTRGRVTVSGAGGEPEADGLPKGGGEAARALAPSWVHRWSVGRGYEAPKKGQGMGCGQTVGATQTESVTDQGGSALNKKSTSTAPSVED